MPVNRRIGDKYAFIFRPVTAPDIIFINIISQILRQHRPVQGKNLLNIKSCRLFKQRLYLCAVFADNIDIIAACFAIPFVLNVKRAEFSESICRKQDFFFFLIRNHNFRPMYHRSHNKRQRMAAQRQFVALIDNNFAPFQIQMLKKLRNHIKSFRIRNNLCFFISVQKVLNICSMIRFHMQNNQIIRLFAIQNFFQILKPFVGRPLVNRIHHGNFIIHNDIGVIGNPFRNNILSLKQVQCLVIGTDIINAFGQLLILHIFTPYRKCLLCLVYLTFSSIIATAFSNTSSMPIQDVSRI